MAENFQTALAAAELGENSSRLLDVGGRAVLLCNADGEFFAIDNVCPHQTSPLEGGRIRRCTIACPLHGMRFELKTGKPLGQLTHNHLRTYPVRVVDGMVEVDLG